jgi:hypothetical protein
VFVKIFPSVSMYEVKEMVFHRRRLLVNEDAAAKFHRRKDDAKSASGEPGLEGA